MLWRSANKAPLELSEMGLTTAPLSPNAPVAESCGADAAPQRGERETGELGEQFSAREIAELRELLGMFRALKHSTAILKRKADRFEGLLSPDSAFADGLRDLLPAVATDLARLGERDLPPAEPAPSEPVKKVIADFTKEQPEDFRDFARVPISGDKIYGEQGEVFGGLPPIYDKQGNRIQ
jgi:hypothetical protein